ncbi:hypothetical protein QLG07_03365 [Erwinia sp. V90_4]|uniref:CDI toxin immunity protein n=1 Tax=Erwinia sp. V90_4 TaxID=3044239 RepID=UPI00249EE4A2|nr:hypothetical protein [Erwinia sp. V90_4]MDI3438490.1 hypothetical protein [Erwinia sp. V90_4]
MTLFDECKQVLSADFSIIDRKIEQSVIALLNQFPIAMGNVLWDKIEHTDYESMDKLLRENELKNKNIFVVADNADIPIFRTNINLFAENVYDVVALSPKIFIFNNEMILQPLFPSEEFRLGIK